MAKKAEMTPIERIKATMNRKETDRVPVVPQTIYCGIRYAGFKVGKCFVDVEEYVQSQLQCLEDFGWDAAWVVGGVDIVAVALGAKTRYYEDDAPLIIDHPIKTREDLERIRTIDVMAQEQIQNRLRCTSELRKAVSKDVAIFALMRAPYNTSCMLRGVECLYRNMISDPGFVTEILEFATEKSIEHALALTEAGADVVWMGNSVAGGLTISRKHYEQFAHPYSKRAFHKLKANGVTTVLHTCGDWNDRFDLVVEEGADCWHVSDYADLGALKERYGDRVALMGNVGSVRVMTGSPEEVAEESRKCIQAAGSNGGFILSADCAVPRDAPKDNMMAMAKAARD